MVDIERVVTLDDLVESVPEDLVRQAEQRKIASENRIVEANFSVKDASMKSSLWTYPPRKNAKIFLRFTSANGGLTLIASI